MCEWNYLSSWVMLQSSCNFTPKCMEHYCGYIYSAPEDSACCQLFFLWSLKKSQHSYVREIKEQKSTRIATGEVLPPTGFRPSKPELSAIFFSCVGLPISQQTAKQNVEFTFSSKIISFPHHHHPVRCSLHFHLDLMPLFYWHWWNILCFIYAVWYCYCYLFCTYHAAQCFPSAKHLGWIWNGFSISLNFSHLN